MPPSLPGSHTFQPPTGTRDFYPQELLRRRYIEKAWRDTAIRHGFEEIDGPTFEHLDLYTVKSGEGIVSEIFGVFSGKDEKGVEAMRQTGHAPYALRPEFTPTLARMYAAKAASLPKPTKWFWQQNCYRAERPQRGRLREFGQWNCDVLGDETVQSDAELLETCIASFRALGFDSQTLRVRISNRRAVAMLLENHGIVGDRALTAFALLDRASKLAPAELDAQARALGVPPELVNRFASPRRYYAGEVMRGELDTAGLSGQDLVRSLFNQLNGMGLAEWCEFDLSIVRGLAYYTGMVFEVHEATGAERAIAGGGRYDNLIETFGGPPTPAVGFGMGDVVLSLVLQDKGLMPTDEQLLEGLGEPTPYRPDVFVLAKDEAADPLVVPTVAALRRGEQGKGGLHARRTYKTTRNLGKLIKDASSARARFVAILNPPAPDAPAPTCSLKNLDSGAQEDNVPLSELPARVRSGAHS